MTRPPYSDYQAEIAAVKASLIATCRDLIRDLNESDRTLEAMAVDEAQLYLRAALKNIDRTLAALNGKEHQCQSATSHPTPLTGAPANAAAARSGS